MRGSRGVHVGWGHLKDRTVSFLKQSILPLLPFLPSIRNSALDLVRERRNVNPNPKLKVQKKKPEFSWEWVHPGSTVSPLKK